MLLPGAPAGITAALLAGYDFSVGYGFAFGGEQLEQMESMALLSRAMLIFWGPISWTVIFGLTFATFLTLVIVPVMYKLTVQISKIFNTRLIRIRKQELDS